MNSLLIKENLYQVVLSEEEVDVVTDYVPCLEDRGMELYVGDNILEKDTLWFILCELNAISHHTSVSLPLTKTLKTLLYPEE